MSLKKVIKNVLLSSLLFNIYSANSNIVNSNATTVNDSQLWNNSIGSIASARASHGVVVKNNSIYVIGGKDRNGNQIDLVEVYNTKTRNYEKKASMPEALSGFATEIIGDNIYCIGGTNGESVVSSVYVYNVVSNTWSKKSDLPMPLTNMSSVVLNGNLYCIGGSGELDVYNKMYMYDMDSDSWIEKGEMNIYREGFSAVAINGKIYALGGTDKTTTHNTAEVYDPNTNSWTLIEDMLSPRMFFDSVYLNGYIYCVGGMSDYGIESMTVDVYDVSNNKWSTKGSISTGVYDYELFESDGFIYLIGGANRTSDALSLISRYATEYASTGTTSTTSNIDVYVKPQSILSMSMDTNIVSFEDFDGVNDYEIPNAINISIESNLSYNLYASLEAEISNKDNTKTIDKSILQIKEHSSSSYDGFSRIKEDVLLKANNTPGKNNHGIDFILKGNVPYEVDVYKTAVKIKVEQQ